MLKKILGLGILLCLVSLAYAQEQITITTYYPSPFGSYRDLETQRLAVAYGQPPAIPSVFWNNFLTVKTGFGDTIAVGGDNVGNDAEIRINAPAARNTVTFWNVGVVPNRLARVNAAICLRRFFTPVSGVIQCPPNYAIAEAPVAAGTFGSYLCCPFCPDANNDGLCD